MSSAFFRSRRARAFSSAFLLITPVLALPQSVRFVDVVQFAERPGRHPTVDDHLSGRTRMQYQLTQFVSMIDRAIDPKVGKLAIRRTPDGKWIPSTVKFSAQDNSFSSGTPGSLGPIVGSKPSEFVVTVSEDGLVRGTETGSNNDIHSIGSRSQMNGGLTWSGTETLDLKTGADTWHFEGSFKAKNLRRMDARVGPFSVPVNKGEIEGGFIADDTASRAIKLVAAIDESAAPGSGTAGDNSRNLTIENARIRNSRGGSTLKFNDLGTLTVSIANHTGVDLKGLRGSVSVPQETKGIADRGQITTSFDIAQGSQTDVKFGIPSDFSLPAGNVELTVTVSYHNAVLARKDVPVQTESFYRTTRVTSPDLGMPRMRAVGRYFGFGSSSYGDPGPELSAAASNDQLAAMWEAVFLSQGAAGYALDQDKAYQIARRTLPYIEEAARSGDAEALYLLFYACQLEAEPGSGGEFLQRSADAGFLPARFDRARVLVQHGDYAKATSELAAVYQSGLKKAAVVLAEMHNRAQGGERDPDAAAKWYRLGVEFGDPEAMLGLANLTAAGFGETPPDASKARELSERAAALKYAPAMVFLGHAYAMGRQGLAQDVPAAVKLFTQAAALGDRQAMLELAELDLGERPGATPDERAAVYWVRRAAERGSPRAMLLLADLYKEGKVVEKDVIAMRYWYNQAVLHGYAHPENRGMAAQQEAFLDFWRYADFTPSYVYVNEYGNMVGDSGDGMINGLFSGMFAAMGSYYGNRQEMIAGLELMEKKHGKKIYGGTVSSPLVSALQLKPGETVSVHSYGVISTGMMSGMADADGLGAQWPEYRIVPYIPCSAVMGRVGDGDWQMIGKHAQITAVTNGPLALALNGKDFRNYKGYFDLVIEVPDEQ